MISKIIEDNEYKELVSLQIKQTLEFLLSKEVEFSITINVDGSDFNPKLPEKIFENLSKFSFFVLSNYTYTTIKLSDDSISFEAGFGSENFGSVVTVPYHAVFQIVLDESILFINSAATVEKFNKKEPVKNSMNVFKNNPNNKNLIP